MFCLTSESDYARALNPAGFDVADSNAQVVVAFRVAICILHDERKQVFTILVIYKTKDEGKIAT